MRSRAAPSCGSRRSAMFKPARIFMREMSACGITPAGAGMARNRPSTRMRTVSPVTERLDMDIAGAQFDRAFEQIVERAHHRRAAREVAQAVDIVIAVNAFARGDFGGLAAVQPLENRGNVLERGNDDLDAVAENDFCGADCGGVQWDRQPPA